MTPIELDPDRNRALIAQLVARHHQLLRTVLPPLSPLVARVAGVHGGHDPRLVELKEAFEWLREVLEAHLDLEEDVLRDGANVPELASAQRQHAEIREALTMLRMLAGGFEVPSWACTSYRKMLDELSALETNVLDQMRTEDELYFPRLAEA